MFRLLVICGLLAGTVFFYLQNQQPIVLVFFGSKTPQIPLAAWVLIFMGGGFLTSLVLSFLRSPAKIQPPTQAVSPPPPQPSTRNLQSSTEPVFTRRETPQPPPLDTRSRKQSDWDTQPDRDEWDIETPPSEGTTTREDQQDIREGDSESELPYSQETQPKTTPRQSSVYSYGYQDTTTRDRRPKDNVYDANYRVINPPPQSSPTPEHNREDEEEEDWI